MASLVLLATFAVTGCSASPTRKESYREVYLPVQHYGEILEETQEASGGADCGDPYKETRRLALERGGFTREEVLFIAARNKPTQEYVRPAFRRMERDLTPESEIERIVAEMHRLDPDLKTSGFEKVLQDEGKRLIRDGRAQGRQDRKGKSFLERQGSRVQGRAGRGALRDTYSEESIKDGITYLLALRLYREPEGQETNPNNRGCLGSLGVLDPPGSGKGGPTPRRGQGEPNVC